MPLPQKLVDHVRAVYPDRKRSSEPWLPMWDPTGRIWYITPFDQDEGQVLYSEDGQCLIRQEVEALHGPLNDGSDEWKRRRQADRATEK